MPSWILLFLLLPGLLLASIDYHVEFQGFINKETLDSLLTNSTLKLLEIDPPPTLTALKRRAESDIPNLVDTLHCLGFYNAKIAVEIDPAYEPVRVLFKVDTGPVYPILGYTIEPADLCINLRDIGILLGTPAYSTTILEGENKLLDFLAVRGYPLATVSKRQVIADQEAKRNFRNRYNRSGVAGTLWKNQSVWLGDDLSRCCS